MNGLALDSGEFISADELNARWLPRKATEEEMSNLPPLPERDPSKPAEQQGIFRKFDVRRTDGSSEPGGKHHGCEYFVLDVDHDPAARAALKAYADAVETTHPELAADMRDRYALEFASAIETAATEPLLQQRIAEFEKENARLHRQNTVLLDEKLKAESEAKELFNVFVKRDKNIAELERQLEEARSLLAISCNHHALIALRNDAERYRWLRVSDKSDDAVIGMDCRGVFVKQREALDAAIDAAMQKGQS